MRVASDRSRFWFIELHSRTLLRSHNLLLCIWAVVVDDWTVRALIKLIYELLIWMDRDKDEMSTVASHEQMLRFFGSLKLWKTPIVQRVFKRELTWRLKKLYSVNWSAHWPWHSHSLSSISRSSYRWSGNIVWCSSIAYTPSRSLWAREQISLELESCFMNSWTKGLNERKKKRRIRLNIDSQWNVDWSCKQRSRPETHCASPLDLLPCFNVTKNWLQWENEFLDLLNQQFSHELLSTLDGATKSIQNTL